MTLPKGFNAKLFDSVPNSNQFIFDADTFNSSQLHLAAETEARELIVSALTTRFQRPCYPVEQMRNPGYMKRNNVTLEDIAAGKIKLV